MNKRQRMTLAIDRIRFLNLQKSIDGYSDALPSLAARFPM